MLLIVSGPVAFPDLRMLSASVTSLVSILILLSLGMLLDVSKLGMFLLESSKSVCAWKNVLSISAFSLFDSYELLL